MLAEGTASLRKLHISCNASLENPVQVFEQAEESFTYVPNIAILTQYEILFAIAAPLIPSPSLKTRTQHTKTCIRAVTPELMSIGKTMF